MNNLDRLARPKGRVRLHQLTGEAHERLDFIANLLTRNEASTDARLVRGAIMEMESACYRLESAADKLLEAFTDTEVPDTEVPF